MSRHNDVHRPSGVDLDKFFYIRKVEPDKWEVMERLDTQTEDHVDDDFCRSKTYSHGANVHLPESSIIRLRSGIVEFIPVCWTYDEAGATRIADALAIAYGRSVIEPLFEGGQGIRYGYDVAAAEDLARKAYFEAVEAAHDVYKATMERAIEKHYAKPAESEKKDDSRTDYSSST